MSPITDESKKAACRTVDALEGEMRRIAAHIGANPELGYQEHRAAAALTAFLSANGLEAETGSGGMATAFMADRRLAEGPAVALLVEYDALPEIGHGCGHNVSGVAAAAAGIAVARSMSRGAIRILGSPAEEGNVPDAGGKVRLVEAGALEGVDAALATHAGPVSILRIDYLARVNVELDFFGKPAHAAAAPEQGVNALDAAVLTINGINALRQHVKPDIRMHGYLAEGGTMVNTIPDFARLRYGVRAKNLPEAEGVLERLLNCARGGALATGCRFEWRHAVRPYAELIDNGPMLEAFAANLAALGEPFMRYVPVSGSTDMGNVSQVVPTIHPAVGYGDLNLGLHTREFAEASLGEPGLRSMVLAAKAMAMTCLDLLHDAGLLRQVRADFESRKKPA